MIRKNRWVRQIGQKFSDQRKDRKINTKNSKSKKIGAIEHTHTIFLLARAESVLYVPIENYELLKKLLIIFSSLYHYTIFDSFFKLIL